jgi:hypothetical protein
MKRMAKFSVRTWMYVVLAVILVVGNLYAFWPFFAADKAVHAFCEDVPAGTPFAELQKRAVAEGYDLTLAPGAPARVEDPRSPGRMYCELPVDASGAVAAR